MIMYSIDIEMSVTDRESSPTPPPPGIPNSEDYPADAVGMMFSYILKVLHMYIFAKLLIRLKVLILLITQHFPF
jgi:hypothetical protein